MRRILTSMVMIAAVVALVAGATSSFFSDTEKSTGNTFAAGTIDISVDDQNPWSLAEPWHNTLDKPCETNYMMFKIKNVGENPANVWKRLTNIENFADQNEGEDHDGMFECIVPNIENCDPVWVSSEPECEDGTKGYTQCYEERDNLSAFMLYDMAICVKVDEATCEVEQTPGGPKPMLDTGWVILINEDQQVRVDNVADTWIKIASELAPNAEIYVNQSYHLTTWKDANQPQVTNWAQGDVMKFDIELEARQLTAPAPGEEGLVTASLVAKNTTTWDPNPANGQGTITYDPSNTDFVYSYSFTNLDPALTYQLIYYPDPWSDPKAVTLIGTAITPDVSGNAAGAGNVNLNKDIPTPPDANAPAGGKVWLVPTTSLSGSDLSWSNPDKFLFDLNLVKYDDTEI